MYSTVNAHMLAALDRNSASVSSQIGNVAYPNSAKSGTTLSAMDELNEFRRPIKSTDSAASTNPGSSAVDETNMSRYAP